MKSFYVIQVKHADYYGYSCIQGYGPGGGLYPCNLEVEPTALNFADNIKEDILSTLLIDTAEKLAARSSFGLTYAIFFCCCIWRHKSIRHS